MISLIYVFIKLWFWVVSVNNLVALVFKLFTNLFYASVNFFAMAFHCLHPFFSGSEHLLPQGLFLVVCGVFPLIFVEAGPLLFSGLFEGLAQFFDLSVVSYEFTKAAIFFLAITNFVAFFLGITTMLLALLKSSLKALFNFSWIKGGFRSLASYFFLINNYNKI